MEEERKRSEQAPAHPDASRVSGAESKPLSLSKEGIEQCITIMLRAPSHRDVPPLVPNVPSQMRKLQKGKETDWGLSVAHQCANLQDRTGEKNVDRKRMMNESCSGGFSIESGRG
jgi:hypothetical protein